MGFLLRGVWTLRGTDAVILIPSLHPDEKLGRYVEDLIAHGFSRIVVVDDGSGPDYAGRFDALRQHPQCAVLSYPDNRGKGFALKHGMHYILHNFQDAPGLVTADSDGQHTAADCLKTAEAMLLEPGKLILGSRDFSLSYVPGKSRAGNRLTSFFFKLLYGHWLPDTQTGLRGISMELMPRFIDIRGDRFEYEMNMLITAAVWHIGFGIVPIDTIYLNENAGTHFRPFHDSARIYRILFANFFRFATVGILSTLLDLVLFTLMIAILIPGDFPRLAESRSYWLVLLATVVARVCSALFNYKLNRRFVFRVKHSKGSLLRYALLVVAVMFVSASLVSLISHAFRMNRTLVKVVVDTVLFFVNYRIAKSWVFTETKGKEPNP